VIRAAIASISRWFRIKSLQSEICGYDEDLQTLRELNMINSKAFMLIEERRDIAQHELYLVSRKPGAAITN
jgi:hypothetical protein